jgi:hypothetical protein
LHFEVGLAGEVGIAVGVTALELIHARDESSKAATTTMVGRKRGCEFISASPHSLFLYVKSAAFHI